MSKTPSIFSKGAHKGTTPAGKKPIAGQKLATGGGKPFKAQKPKGK